MHIVVMGVSGAGKSTVGRILADELGYDFIEADLLHPPANITKMTAGIPLDDSDRAPWLKLIRQKLVDAGTAGSPSVLVCSALRTSYRDIIRSAGDVFFVHLEASPELISERLAQRQDHFMPPSLQASQFHAMEALTPSELGITVDGRGTPADVSARILTELHVSVLSSPDRDSSPGHH